MTGPLVCQTFLIYFALLLMPQTFDYLSLQFVYFVPVCFPSFWPTDYLTHLFNISDCLVTIYPDLLNNPSAHRIPIETQLWFPWCSTFSPIIWLLPQASDPTQHDLTFPTPVFMCAFCPISVANNFLHPVRKGYKFPAWYHLNRKIIGKWEIFELFLN